MQFSKSLLISAVGLLLPLLGQAAPISSNPTLMVGGMTFSNFDCTVTGTGSPHSCGQIDVKTITSPGIGIQIDSGFEALPFQFTDAAITYDLLAPGGIDHIGLSFDGYFYGLAITSVTESVYSGSTLVGSATVACGVFAGCTKTATVNLNGIYNNLHVEKDIFVGASLGVAGTSIIDQTFADAPEPSSIALLGSGLFLAAAAMRRSRKALKA
jgi:hypothetical protein